jgi:hypothetical protein
MKNDDHAVNWPESDVSVLIRAIRGQVFSMVRCANAFVMGNFNG